MGVKHQYKHNDLKYKYDQWVCKCGNFYFAAVERLMTGVGKQPRKMSLQALNGQEGPSKVIQLCLVEITYQRIP